MKSWNLFSPPLALASLRLATFSTNGEAIQNTSAFAIEPEETIEETAERRLKELTVAVGEVSGCSACNLASFGDRLAQKEHYKLDWHRYNLHQSLAGRQPVVEEAFEKMVETGEADDVSSLSGSDTDEDEPDVDKSDNFEEGASLRRNPWLFFEDNDGYLMSILRVAVDVKGSSKYSVDEEEPEKLDRQLIKNLANTTGQWAVLMLGGGHFAGAVFERGKAVVHKTFHCYTVRKGQGGSQSAKDGKSGGSHPKSAGASLRRYL